MGFPVIDPFLSCIGLPTTTEILDWVTGDPTALREAGAGWSAAAGNVKASRTEVEAGLRDVANDWTGEAYQAFADYLTEVVKELDKEADAMLALSVKLGSVANSLAVARDKVVRIFVRLAAALIPLTAIAIFPPLGAVSLAAGATVTAAAFASIIVIAQSVSGVLQGIPDLLNDLHGLEFAPTAVTFPSASGVPLRGWTPQAQKVDPDSLPAPNAGATNPKAVGGGASAPGVAAAPSAAVTPRPAIQQPTLPLQPAAPTGPTQGEVLIPGDGAVIVDRPDCAADLRSGLPPGYAWAPPGAALPPTWYQDALTGQLLPLGATACGAPPPGLLPGCGWIAPDTELPAGWRIDPGTDVLIGPPPQGFAEPNASGWEAALRPGGSAFTPQLFENVSH